jgi:predicted CopG family antitoxin
VKKKASVKTIAVSLEVYDHLVQQGGKNETFDEILKRLLGLAKEETQK